MPYLTQSASHILSFSDDPARHREPSPVPERTVLQETELLGLVLQMDARLGIGSPLLLGGVPAAGLSAQHQRGEKLLLPVGSPFSKNLADRKAREEEIKSHEELGNRRSLCSF